jgi:hypothetical protein
MDGRWSRRAVLPLAALAAMPEAVKAGASGNACPGGTPVAGYQPSANAKTFTGSGHRVSQPIALKAGLLVMQIDATGQGVISTSLLRYPSGELGFGPTLDGLPSAGSYADHVDAGNYVLTVESGGSWVITIDQPAGHG